MNKKPSIAIGLILVILIAASAFYIGKMTVLLPIQPAVTSGPVLATPAQPAASQSTPQPAAQEPDFKGSLSVFESYDSRSNTSAIVGYIGRGAFVMELPDWISGHWKMDTQDGNTFTLYPVDNIDRNFFSDIVIAMRSSDEEYNAETLYELDKKNTTDLILAEVFLNTVGDLRIYHVQRDTDDGFISDNFYVDGNSKTAKVIFYADKRVYSVAGSKVREFIQGFSLGKGIQG